MSLMVSFKEALIKSEAPAVQGRTVILQT